MLAKLCKPRLHQPIQRPRLFARLDRRQECPVLWVSGPAGAGKSTLVASYVESCGIVSHWIQLDPGDSDPGTFFHYLGELAAGASTRPRTVLPVLTPELAGTLAAFSHRFFRAFFEKLPPGSVVVIDNIHEAISPDLEIILREGLGEVPPGMNVLLLSRQQLPAALARQRLAGNLETIDWEELKFTDEESRDFAAPHGIVDAGKVQRLRERVDGWAAGLALLLANGAADEGFPDESRTWSNEVLFDYFAGEVFSRATPEQQHTLLCTSLLPEFTAPMARALSSNDHADRALELLYRSQFFITRRQSTEDPIYQYHDLFRAFLMQRARREKKAGEFLDLQLLAADVLATHGQVEPAIELFLFAQKHDSAVAMIRSVAERLIALGRGNVLLGWFASLPNEIILADPWLAYWRGAGTLWADPACAYRDFDHARAQFADLADHEGQLRAVMSLLEAVEFTLSDYRAKDPWISELLRLLQPARTIETDPVRLRAWAMLLVSMIDRTPGDPAIADAIATLLRASAQIDMLPPDLRLQIAWGMLYYGLESADHSTARRAFAIAKDLPDSQECSPSVRCTWWHNEGWYHFAHGDWTSSIASFERMAKVAEEFRIQALELIGRGSSILIRIVAGELEATARDCAALSSMLDDRQYMATRIVLKCEAMLSWMRGELTRAVGQVDPAVRAVDELGLADVRCCTRIDMSAICFEAEDFARAKKLLDEAEQVTKGTAIRYLDGAILGLHAALAIKDRNNAQATRKALVDCMALLHNPGTQGGFAVLGPIASRVCHEALVGNIEPDFVRELIRNMGLKPCPGATAAWPWPVKIRALGTFEIFLPDGPLRKAGRTPYKVLESLKRLVAAGAKGASATSLCDALWPDAEGDSAQASFHTNIHRLRRMLGRDDAILMQDGKVMLDRAICWVDAFEFESVAEKASSDAAIAGAADQARTHGAMALYAGPLMPDETDGTIASQRDRLQAKYLRLVTRLASGYEAAAQWHAARRVYEQALEGDLCNDVLFMRLVRCLREARDHEALADWSQRRYRLAQVGAAPLSREIEEFLAAAPSAR